MKHIPINNIAGRLLTAVLLLTLSWSSAQAEEIEMTATFNSNVWGTTARTLDGSETWKVGAVTLSHTVDGGSYSSSITSSGMFKCEYSGTVTFSVPTGCTITAMTITGSGNALSASTGSISGSSWTGSAQSVTLTPGSDGRDVYNFESIVLTYMADLNILASVSGSVATYDFTTSNATPFVDVSLHAKTITAGSQEVYLDGFNASSDPMVQMSMTNMSTYLHMPAGSRLWVQRSSNSSNVYITQVKFTTTSGYPDLTPDGGTYDATTGVWTGSEDQLIFTVNADADIQSIEVTAVELFKLSVSTQGRGKISVNGTELTRSVDPQTGYLVSSTEEYVEAGRGICDDAG